MANGILNRVKSAFTTVARGFVGNQWRILPNGVSAKASKDPLRNSAVMACCWWGIRNFPEAPLEVWKADPLGDDAIVPMHPASDLVRSPNPYYGYTTMAKMFALDAILEGNSYILIVRDSLRRPCELWYEFPVNMEPRRDPGSDNLIDYYDRKVGVKTEGWDVADVIHVRYGPLSTDSDMMKSIAPFQSLLLETLTLSEATLYIRYMLQNMGIVSVILSPAGDNQVITEDIADDIEEKFQAKVTGKNRGKPLVFRKPIKVDATGPSPADMAIDKLIAIPEQRICAVIGIPRAVAGVGGGSESAFGNGGELKQLRESATEEWIIPTQRDVAEAFTHQFLMPEYNALKAGIHFAYNLKNVRCLQEDQDKLWTRIVSAYSAQLISQQEGRTALGYSAEIDTAHTFAQPKVIVGPAKTMSGQSIKDRDRNRKLRREVEAGNADLYGDN